MTSFLTECTSTLFILIGSLSVSMLSEKGYIFLALLPSLLHYCIFELEQQSTQHWDIFPKSII